MDVKSENEAKMSALVVRVNSILWALFCLVSVAIEVFYFKPLAITLCILGIFLAAVMFDLTYQNKTQIASALLIICTMLFSACSLFLYGESTASVNFTFVTIILIYILDLIPHRFKAFSVFSLIIYRLTLIHFVRQVGAYYTLVDNEDLLWQFVNLIFITLLTTFSIYIATKDFNAMQQKLISYNNKLQAAASIDPLTNLYNRRAMIDIMEKEIRAYKHGEVFSISIAIADIDFFKKINDTYGHNGGDFILKEMAKIFKGFMAKNGCVARWGGEEFLFIFHDINGDEAYIFLDTLRKQIAEQEFVFEETVIKLTLSFGLTEFDSRNDLDSNVMDADKNLYLAKAQGRNRVIF